MERRIFKFKIPLSHGTFELLLPPDAEPLTVNMQGPHAFMWILGDFGGLGRFTRKFRVVYTGGTVPEEQDYIGSIITKEDGEDHVVHYFEMFEKGMVNRHDPIEGLDQ